MSVFQNKSNWFWAGLALTIVNLAFLVTILIKGVEKRPVPPGEMPPEMTRGGYFIVKELGFSQEQIQEFHQLRSEYFTETKELHKDLFEAKQHMLKEIALESPDKEKLSEISGKIGELYAQINSYTTRHLLDVKNICTPEQQRKLVELYQHMQEPGKYRNRRMKGRGFRHQRGRQRERGE